jgi:thiamine biosynthesis lipoprotein
MVLLAGCANAPRLQSLDGQTMGTTWSVKFVSETAPEPLRQGIQQRLDQVVAQMSTWEASSDLSRFNQAPAGTWQVLPAEFYTVLSYAIDLAKDTAGAYDPTVGPLVNLWGFGPDKQRREAPDAAAIAAARERVGWQRVQLDPTQRRALQPGGIYVDLSSVAKGFGVDQVADYLDAAGITDYLVEVGGELRGRGRKPDGEAWQVAVQRPLENDRADDSVDAEYVLGLHDLAIATSGDYRHFFEDHGHRYSHTIDPRTGYPVEHELASVTVLHRDCMHADALATALTVLGADEGLEYARRHDFAALFIVRNGDRFEEHMTPAFAAALAR